MLDALDAGLPVTAMKTDVAFAAEYIEIMCDLALGLGGQTIPATGEHLHYTLREPFGVVARIVPPSPTTQPVVLSANATPVRLPV